jgi:predicted RNase H-like HicB family nuclease
MDRYEVELEPAEPDGFAAVVPALPGLLVLGRSVDEVLERVRAAIAFRVALPPPPGDDGLVTKRFEAVWPASNR